MTSVPQVLADVKKRRELDGHRDTLMRPWSRTFFPVFSSIPLLVLLGIELVMPTWGGFDNRHSATEIIRCLIFVALIAGSLASTLSALRKRERAWLALIENECPQLYRELRQPRP